MPEIEPFKAYYYKVKNQAEFESLVAPPHDVISETERIGFRQKNPDNIVQIILPDSYVEAGRTLNHWISTKRILQLKAPALFVYETKYLYNDEEKRRYGLIALVKLSEFSEKKVLPHERTFKKVTEGQLNLLQESHANFNPIFFIFNGNEVFTQMIHKYSSAAPFRKARDRDNVEHTVWMVDNPQDISILQKYFKDIPLVIADGHHRYNSALMHSREGGNPYIMGLIVDMNDPGLQIYPTHRLIRYIPHLNTDQILNKIKDYFAIENYPFNQVNMKEIITQLLARLTTNSQYSFGLMFNTQSSFFLISLKENFKPENLIPGTNSPEWKHLDVSLLHEFLLTQLLGIPNEVNDSENIVYIKNLKLHEVVESVQQGIYQLLFILNPTKVDQILKITAGSEIMPHKSTYFYPKPLSGVLIYKWK